MTSIYEVTTPSGTNRIIATEAFVAAVYPDAYAYIGPAPEAELARTALTPLTRRQLRLALLSIGVTAEDVEAHIADIADPIERAAAMIEWEDATHYKRDHPLVADVAMSMALPAEQVDALWVWALEL